MELEYLSSKLLADAVEEFSKLPGIGSKTALRLVLHLLDQEDSRVEAFANSVLKLKKEVKRCKICHNISDDEVCNICANPKRDHSIVCVVENIKDIIAIEKTHQYQGVYHVLGGLISPVDGIGPEKLNIETLIDRVKNSSIQEIILALNTTMEGEATSFYLYKKMSSFPVRITTLARGVGFGDELEYTDEITLGKAITNRVDFDIKS